MRLSGGYNSPLSAADAISIIQSVYDKGITLFDTAGFHGNHANEVLVGKVQLPAASFHMHL